MSSGKNSVLNMKNSGTMTVLENRLDTIWSKATVMPTGQPIAEQQVDAISRKYSTRSISEGMIPDEVLHVSITETIRLFQNDGTVPNEYMNNFTIRSIATFMKANGDVYGGAFGRVNIRRGDLRNLPDNQTTVRSQTRRDSTSNV